MAKTFAKFQKVRYKIVWGVVLTRYPLSIHWGQKMTKFTKWKKWQKIISQLYPNHMHKSSYHDENTCKVSNRSVQNCKRSCAHKTPRVNVDGNDKVRKVEKVTKINARIISKPYAHLQTMEKTCAKFQKDRYKIVWGVALTRYPLSIHWGQKMTKFTKWKKWQKIISQLYPNHVHTSSYHDDLVGCVEA